MALRLRKNLLTPLRTYARSFATAVEESSGDAHEGKDRLWMLLSVCLGVPGVGFCYYNAYRLEDEEAKHPRAEFVPYSHLRMRTKRFPWGDGNHSLFHNPKANALPDGYEE